MSYMVSREKHFLVTIITISQIGAKIKLKTKGQETVRYVLDQLVGLTAHLRLADNCQ